MAFCRSAAVASAIATAAVSWAILVARAIPRAPCFTACSHIFSCASICSSSVIRLPFIFLSFLAAKAFSFCVISLNAAPRGPASPGGDDLLFRKMESPRTGSGKDDTARRDTPIAMSMETTELVFEPPETDWRPGATRPASWRSLLRCNFISRERKDITVDLCLLRPLLQKPDGRQTGLRTTTNHATQGTNSSCRPVSERRSK